MAVAVDSSVLIHIFQGSATAEAWVNTMAEVRSQEELLICDVVMAEIAPFFASFKAQQQALDALGVRYDVILPPAAVLAGQIFQTYRRAGGSRTHLIPDFLVGAHAQLQAGRLIAADRGYLRAYFNGLPVIAL